MVGGISFCVMFFSKLFWWLFRSLVSISMLAWMKKKSEINFKRNTWNNFKNNSAVLSLWFIHRRLRNVHRVLCVAPQGNITVFTAISKADHTWSYRNRRTINSGAQRQSSHSCSIRILPSWVITANTGQEAISRFFRWCHRLLPLITFEHCLNIPFSYRPSGTSLWPYPYCLTDEFGSLFIHYEENPTVLTYKKKSFVLRTKSSVLLTTFFVILTNLLVRHDGWDFFVVYERCSRHISSWLLLN